MKTRSLFQIVIGFALVASTACNSSGPKGAGKVELKTFEDSVAYALGYYIAFNNDDQGWDPINTEIMASAMHQYWDEGDSSMFFGTDVAGQILNQNAMNLREQEKLKNMKDGDAFLENNKTKEGVTTLPSGLQYKIIQEGNGVKPDLNDSILVHYTGSFIDGEVFQSSRDAGEPVLFSVERMIPGWKEALQLMPEGSRWELYIPAGLAYGARGRDGIPPGSALVFDMELFKVTQVENVENQANE